MKSPSPASMKISARGPFANVAPTAAEHFRLAIFGAIAHLIEAATRHERDAVLAAHPFLATYAEEIAARLQRPGASAAQWRQALAAWEAGLAANLPLRGLTTAGLGPLEIELLMAVGVPEEDPRFSDLFEDMLGRERKPTAGLLLAWWRTDEVGEDRAEDVRRALFGLVRNGLLTVANPTAPRSEWALTVPPPLWDALRGEPPALAWLRHVAMEDQLSLERYVAPASVTRIAAQLAGLLATQHSRLLVVRGPQQNGRKTLLGVVARTMGKGLLIAGEGVLDEPPHWQLFGMLSVILGALPVLELDLASGENRTLPALPFVTGPLAVVTGLRGGVHTSDARTILTVPLPLPDAECRRLHWEAVAPLQSASVLDALARSVHLSSGNIRRAAQAAIAYAQLDCRRTIEARDVQLACRGLHSARLETLATRLETRGNLDDLALDEITRNELDTLLARCQHREALAAAAGECGEGASRACGVRALLSGPSGTGKTLAARILAAVLGKDLYRVDVAATVNKYLGETEKNLDRAFSAAEELDSILLLDEGDALMGTRTDVGSSNDRYANLETNFLLQRIESFGGILLVTTNAPDRIDKAFARRMDVVIPFRAPDELRRYEILRLQLGNHDIDDRLLQELACRCALTGGQLRNVTLHAQLVALQAGRVLSDQDLRAALQREYRKIGAHCPLKSFTPGAYET